MTKPLRTKKRQNNSTRSYVNHVIEPYISAATPIVRRPVRGLQDPAQQKRPTT